MEQHESLVVFRDIAGVQVHFSAKQIDRLIRSLSSEQQRYAKILANTIKEPQEIWQHWMPDERESGMWQQIRTYLHYLDLSATNVEKPFGVAIAQFVFRLKWEILALDIKTGEMDDVMPEINKIFRVGNIEYSSVLQPGRLGIASRCPTPG